MPQCPICNAAVWVDQQYCTTCTNPLPPREKEDYLCPQCGIRMDTQQETCQRCKVTLPETVETLSVAPAGARKLRFRVPGVFIGAGSIIVALLLVFLFHKSPGPSQLVMTTPPSQAVSERTPAAPSAPTVAAVRKLAVPSAPAASSPPAATAPTPALPRYIVNVHELSVRKGPKMDASYIAYLNIKDEVELLETSGDWGKLRDVQRHIVGWSYMRYLQPVAADGPRAVSQDRVAGPKVSAPISSPPQLLTTPPSQADSGQKPAAPSVPASAPVPSPPTEVTAQKVPVPVTPVASSPPALIPPTPPQRYFVNTHELSVREDPTMDASCIATLNFKDEVELLETSDGWGKVRDPKRHIVGWSYMRFLQPLSADGPQAASQHRPTGPKEPEPISAEASKDM